MENHLSRRVIGFFCCFLIGTMVLFGRLAVLTGGEEMAAAVTAQGQKTLEVAKGRGMIYDRNLQPLVNEQSSYRAAVMPTEQAIRTVTELLPEQSMGILELARQGNPFTLELPTPYVYSGGVYVFEIKQRYSDPPLAPHIVGYTDTAGTRGLSGIEKAYDTLLTQEEAAIRVSYQADVLGNPVEGTTVQVDKDGYAVKEGVVLTLDKEIQQICRDAALGLTGQSDSSREPMEKGGVLVMDPHSGDILACVSFPEFSQNDVAASLEAEDSPFLNRCLSAYNVGSPFKLVVAAAALENGISRYHTYTCKGYEDIGGQIFYCNNLAGHGEIDMKTAVEESCNTYFIHLMDILGPDAVMLMARSMGFGNGDQLAEGISGAAGNLPELELLRSLPAEAANLSFGQGQLLATPLQLAKMISVIAGGGNSVTPRLVIGTTNQDATAVASYEPVYAANPAILPRTAAVLREFMIGVVEEGSGIYAQPEEGGAGGKTGSAQTGIYREDEELVHAWFTGFYPALSPQYVIVVFVEEGESGAKAAAPIFKDIVDQLAKLDR